MSTKQNTATKRGMVEAAQRSPLADIVSAIRPAIMAGIAKEIADSFGISLNGSATNGAGSEAPEKKDVSAVANSGAISRQRLISEWFLAEISAENLLVRTAKAYEKLQGTKELLSDCRAAQDDSGNPLYPDSRSPAGIIAAMKKKAKEQGKDLLLSEIPGWVLRFRRLFDAVRKAQEAYRKQHGTRSQHGNSGEKNAVHNRVTAKGEFSAWLKKNYDVSPFFAGACIMVDSWGDWQSAANALAERANVKPLDIAAAMSKAKPKAKK